MRDDWVDTALELSRRKASFYSGARKIIRGRSIEFNDIEDDLSLADAGYTKSKMTMLKKLYVHEESRRAAIEQWDIRRKKAKYGSVGFHCYNHLVKGHGNEAMRQGKGESDTVKTSRASIMGPCLQSVCLTLQNNKRTGIDIFYRTTEYYKKFPADLVLIRDVLLEGFDVDIESIRFHFANITMHPMYFVTLIPRLQHPWDELDKIKKADKYFFDWIVKWTARYICPEHHRGIAKFGQAMRVHADAHKRIDKTTLGILRKYLLDNHPGYRNGYEEDEDEDDN